MSLANVEGLQEWKRLGEDLTAMTAFPIERFLGNLGAESVSARALAGRFLAHFSPSGVIFIHDPIHHGQKTSLSEGSGAV